MFICNVCHVPQPIFSKPLKKIIETRHKVYTRIEKDRFGNEKVVEVGEGDEIVRELNVCSPCY